MVKMTCVQCDHLLDVLPLTFNIVVQVDATFYREELQFQRGRFRIVSTELSNTDILPVKCPHCGFGAQLRNLVKVVYYCNGCEKKLKQGTALLKLYCHELDKRYCEPCFKNKIEGYCGTCSYRSSCERRKKPKKRRKATGDRRARNADIRRRFRMDEGGVENIRLPQGLGIDNTEG